MISPPVFLETLFNTVVEHASASNCLSHYLPKPPTGKTVVVGAGKAAASMAATLESHWRGVLEGVVITPYNHTLPCSHIEVVEAGHPIPDEAGYEATQKILSLLSGTTRDDLVLCLISGGASSLLVQPAPFLSLDEKKAIHQQLLQSGAPISELNRVRKHLSAIKGGQLALAALPARVVSLIISDVPGDDLGTIGSGPTVPDPSSASDALAILDRFKINLSPTIIDALQSGDWETPGNHHSGLTHTTNHLIMTPDQALRGAINYAFEEGFTPLYLGDDLEGEAREVGSAHAQIATEMSHRTSSPWVILSGGETSVTVRGEGRGGRNLEFLLSLAIALGENHSLHAIACDTDGIDGTEDCAGAKIGPDTLARARSLGINPEDYLDNNDSFTFFHKLGDLVVTGPTLTNVNDFRAICSCSGHQNC